MSDAVMIDREQMEAAAREIERLRSTRAEWLREIVKEIETLYPHMYDPDELSDWSRGCVDGGGGSVSGFTTLTEAELAEQCRSLARLLDEAAEGGGTSSWMLAVTLQGTRLHDMLAYKLSKPCEGGAS